jgi:hypothetical protein
MLTKVLVSGPEKADGIGLLPQECATTKMGRKSIHSRLRRWLRHECRRALRLGRGLMRDSPATSNLCQENSQESYVL